MVTVTRLGLSTLLAGGLTILLHIIGVATDYWLVLANPNGNTHLGLWRVCGQQRFGVELCFAYGDVSSRFNIARVFEVFAIAWGGGAMLLLFLKHVTPQVANRRTLRFLPLTHFISAGAFGLVGIFLFCDPIYSCGDSGGWSFYITVVSSCLFIVAAAPLSYKVAVSEWEGM